MTITEHHVEIVYGRTVYRFFGRGVWMILTDDKWRSINGIHVPADVLKIAAGEVCTQPSPVGPSSPDTVKP